MRNLIDAAMPEISKAMDYLGITQTEWSRLIGPTTVPDHGDIAIPCHAFSKTLKKSPVDIAETIASAISASLVNIATVGAINGFVNITANASCLSPQASLLPLDQRLGVPTQ